MNVPSYLARPSDGSILKKNEDGTYSFIDSKMSSPYKYKLDVLLSYDFEIVTENDFDELRKRNKIYHEWLDWHTRSDGHGGSKGGTIEEFKQLKGYI